MVYLKVVLLDSLGNFSTLQYLIRTGSQFRLYGDHAFDKPFQITRVNRGWIVEYAFYDLLVQVVHVLGSERRLQS